MRTFRLPVAGLVTAALLCGAHVAVAQETSTDTGLLPGVDLVTEEVEPGVFRVVSDGVRELPRPIEFEIFWGCHSPGDLYRVNVESTGGIAANSNGVWLGTSDGIVRLGETGLAWERTSDDDWWQPAFDVAPDDSLFRPAGGVIFDGETWRKVKAKTSGFTSNRHAAIRFAPDGSLWVKGTNGKPRDKRRELLAYRDEDGWTRVKAPPDPGDRDPRKRRQGIDRWGVTGDGTLYVTRGRRDVQRFDGTSWETLERPEGDIQALLVGADGTVWLRTRPQGARPNEELVLRLGEDGWTEHDIGRRYMHWFPNEVGLDGAYWYGASGDLMISGGCDGVGRLDGTSATRFLPGMCVYDMTVGPGGDVWVIASTWDGDYYSPDVVGPIEVYAITAEAAEAAT